MEKQTKNAVIGIAIGVLAFLIFIMALQLTIVRQEVERLQPAQQSHSMTQRFSMMKLSEFDRAKATELMDKDNDGRCDYCGMPVEMCIDSGEMQCSMDPSSTIGKLGTQHIHADWKMYINGKAFDWRPYADRHQRQMMGDKSIKDTSAFIHIHPAEAPEQAGDLLHMHATGISLSLFFESMGMSFDKECIALATDAIHCADSQNALKLYVNGKQNNQLGEYVFQDTDKILISYGPKGEDVSQQMASITNFAGGH